MLDIVKTGSQHRRAKQARRYSARGDIHEVANTDDCAVW
jgi:hypothetical protein